MKLSLSHPVGTEFQFSGTKRHALAFFEAWWNACSDIYDQARETVLNQEHPEPSPSGADSQAERAYPRYFESESIYGQDVPIIQASTGTNTTRIPLGFTRNEETA